jgi:nucleotide-binding universal stress UspA family protein
LILLRVGGPVHGGTGAQAELLRDELAHGMVTPQFTERAITAAKHPIYTSQVEAGVEATLKQEMQPSVEMLEKLGYHVSTAVEFGDPAESIINYANLHAIDLIAMATHGRTGIRRLLVDSVAEEILRHVVVPVMMLRPFDAAY